jgi:hypothetical protein
MFILDNKPIQIDTPFEHDGVQYPANWLRLASPEDRAAIGIIEVVEQPRPDDRFYWVSQNPDGTWTAIPKDLAGLKVTWKAQFKQTAWTLLNPSDWLVVRKQEVGTAIPAEWSSYRDMVRATCEIVIADAENAADIDAFITAVTSVVWPVSPDNQPVVEAVPDPVAPQE